jgi:PPOX class probable FMN-dependent enzyme
VPEPFTHPIASEAALRALYREPSELVRRKKVSRIDPVTRRYIEASPFCLIATADAEGRCDVSPRGGPPGFVRVLDEHRVAVPDLSGNNLLDSLTNLVANPHVGLLLLIPGRDETLRIEGDAHLTTDPQLLALWDDELRRPKVAIGVTVRTLYPHCAKSFRRGRVWDAASWAELDAPDACDLSIAQLDLDVAPADARSYLEAGYTRDLTEEREQRGAPR